MQSNRIEKMDKSKLIKIITGKRDSKWTEETQEVIEAKMSNKKYQGKKEC